MDMNTAMRFVVKRAMAEKSFIGASGMRPEHVLLGILKLAELSAEDIAPSSGHKSQIDADIEGVKDFLKGRDINPALARSLLRDVRRKEENERKTSERSGNEEMSKLFDRAARTAEEEGAETLTALHFLDALFADPPETIKVILDKGFSASVAKMFAGKEEKGGENTGAKETEKPGSPLTPQERLAQLPGLAERIRHLRDSLMEKILGQDHAVHEFSESLFGAELLADADDERRQPRAIFVFAGPPGVGKTFLAEQGAAALGLPYKRFEMSGYADHQSQVNLIGLAPSYRNAKPGALTGFVKENPHCILLFDEIEKAHLNVIQLFLQILDAGNLHDDFFDEDIAFKDAVIIFTTNAGKQLYEGESKANAAGIPRQVILNALETDINPQTGTPYFPAAICSRMATGSTVLFNHLKAHDLEKICEKELERCSGLFEKQYGVKIEVKKDIPPVLLFSQGGLVDARTLRARTELFFKNEVFKLSGLFSGDSFAGILEKIDGISFTVDIAETGKAAANEIQSLFNNPDKPGILLFTSAINAARLEASTGSFMVYRGKSREDAFKIAGEKDISLVLLDLAYNGDLEEEGESDPMGTVPDGAQRIKSLQRGTMAAFTNIPMAAGALRGGRFFFKELVERIPELPVYLLETWDFTIDDELLVSFMRAGARGKLKAPRRNDGSFAETLGKIAAQLYLQNSAAKIAAEQKALYFETAPKISEDKRHIDIRLRDLVIKRNINAVDAGEILAEAGKPEVRFHDVIGASGAKDELKFFVDFLKNPKKFSAQGIKPPKGVLLYGPPGTGKTLLARAMAGESDTAFIPAVASSFVTMWQGSGPESVRQLFGKARKYAPSVVFIDEIDAIGRKRLGGPGAHGEEMALNALLTEMDGFTVYSKRPVFVLAATNFEIDETTGSAAVLDPALVRRFDRTILVDMPAKEDRRRYLQLELGKNKTGKVTAEMIEQLAGRSAGLSLANLAAVVEMANRNALKRNEPLSNAILEEAFEISQHGEKKDWGESYMERVARHESGHAFLCYLAGRTPSYLTIVARGSHGGYMEADSGENSPLETKEELLGRLRTALGGRAAEIAYYGEKDGLSTGASGDLSSAANIARAMICSYGMDEETGYLVLSPGEAVKGPMAAKISGRVAEIIKNELAFSVEIILKEKKRIDRLVKALLEKNRLNRTEIEELLK
jgi:ATP-dependent metalloprotease FtsH